MSLHFLRMNEVASTGDRSLNFLCSEGAEPVPHDNRLCNEALRDGDEISETECALGK